MVLDGQSTTRPMAAEGYGRVNVNQITFTIAPIGFCKALYDYRGFSVK